MSSSSVMPSTGVATTWMMLVAYRAHRNRGILNHGMPGGRNLWMVTIKLMPVKMELMPRINAPRVMAITLVPVVVL